MITKSAQTKQAKIKVLLLEQSNPIGLFMVNRLYPIISPHFGESADITKSINDG